MINERVLRNDVIKIVKLNKSDRSKQMIRASSTVISWVKMCPTILLNPKTNVPNSLTFKYANPTETLTSLDKSMLFSSKYCMAKKK
jgi:hypothetical protein